MSSLVSEVKLWLESYERNLNFILISFDEEIIESLLRILVDCRNLNKIVLSNVFLDHYRTNGQRGTSKFEREYENKIIDTAMYGGNPSACIFLCDFNNSSKFTPKNLDYFETIDRQVIYRTHCLSVMMYRFKGNPPLNGFWMLKEAKIDGNNSMVFLELSEWGRICQGKPGLSVFATQYGTSDILSRPDLDIEWMNSARGYLSYLIFSILGTDIYTDQLLSDENICIWIRGFTHETFNYTTNYDSLEFLGDRLCKTYFSIYMITKYPRLLKNELTEYFNQYMSAEHQWYLAHDLNLEQFVLADREVLTFTKEYKTDLFESFVGSLFETCQKINPSLANVAMINLFTLVGEQFPFEKKMIYGTDKHRITQILSSLDSALGSVKVKFEEQNTGSINASATYSLDINPACMGFFEKLFTDHGKDLRPLFSLKYKFIPGVVTRQTAENSFWHSIAKIFDSADVDIRFVKSLKKSFLFTISIFDPECFQRVKERLSLMYPKEDPDVLINKVQFKSNKESNNNYVIMYIHTFEAEPESKLLNSLVLYTDQTQKAGDDCIDECEDLMQIKNLAVVKTPQEGSHIDSTNFQKSLTTHETACYNCAKKFVLN